MGDDRGKESMTCAPWVWRAWQKPPPFDPIKERETFLEATRKFEDSGASSSQNPQRTIQNNDPSGISQGKDGYQGTLRNFLESCMKLVRDQNALAGLQAIISTCDKKIGERTLERVVNQVRWTFRIGGDMRLTA